MKRRRQKKRAKIKIAKSPAPGHVGQIGREKVNMEEVNNTETIAVEQAAATRGTNKKVRVMILIIS